MSFIDVSTIQIVSIWPRRTANVPRSPITRSRHGAPCIELLHGPRRASLAMLLFHYCDAIMSAMASQITSLTTVYSTDYSAADQIKHQSSASLAFVRRIHRWPVNSPHKWSVTRKMFPFDDVIMLLWPTFLAYDPNLPVLLVLRIICIMNSSSFIGGGNLPMKISWWRHPMETYSAFLALCAGNSPVTALIMTSL